MKLADEEKRLRKQLDEVKNRLVHPEQYDPVTGAKLLYKHQQWRKPMEPRYRLSARLELLSMLKKYEIALMNEVLEDKEAALDAKAHPDGGTPE